MKDLSVNVGDGTGQLNVKRVDGDNTEINNVTHQSLDVDLLRQLIEKEQPELIDDPNVSDSLRELEKQKIEPEGFEKALGFLVNVAQGITIRWLSKMMLS